MTTETIGPASTQAFEATTVKSVPAGWEVQWHPDPRSSHEWFEAALRQIEELRSLATNWNTYGAPRLTEPTSSAAAFFLALVRSLGSVGLAPSVAPTSEGFIHLEWNRDEMGMELEIEPTATMHYALFRADDVVAEGTVTPERYPVVAYLVTRVFS